MGQAVHCSRLSGLPSRPVHYAGTFGNRLHQASLELGDTPYRAATQGRGQEAFPRLPPIGLQLEVPGTLVCRSTSLAPYVLNLAPSSGADQRLEPAAVPHLMNLLAATWNAAGFIFVGADPKLVWPSGFNPSSIHTLLVRLRS